ncbi:MAG: site-specific integrase [Alistipes sp.]|nr:site-specific integrase [Alistipes sp.]
MENNVSIGLFLDTRREMKKQGAGVFGVKADLRYMGRRWQFATPFVMTQDEWESVNSRKIRTEALKDKKIQIEAYRTKAVNIIESLHPFSIEKFKELMLGKGKFSKAENRDVCHLFDEYIRRLMLRKAIRTAHAYHAAKRALQSFKPKLFLEDVTAEFLQRFENYLTGRGNSGTTVGIYMRSLRAVLNEAIENGLMRREDYPFGRRRYNIPAPKQAKIALPQEQIRAILDYCPETAEEQRAKDMWVFSYFCGGMNINDICRLRHDNIQGDLLTFRRYKTKNTSGRTGMPVRIVLQSEVREIIGRQKTLGAYIFPVLEAGLSDERTVALIKQHTKTTNKYLKQIGRKLGIARLTTQTARHSFATTLMNHGAPLTFISKSMGHSTTRTTEIYLGSFTMHEAEQYGAMLRAL